MAGGEPCSAEGQVVSMICLGFEDSSELTQSPQSPHWPNWVPSGNGEILWIKNRSEFNFGLFSLRYIIWLIFWPARIEIVRVKNL